MIGRRAVLAGLAAQPASAWAETVGDVRLMDILIAAYPDFLSGHDGNDLIFRDGTRMPFDDGRRGKTLNEMLDGPCLRDMFYAPYPLGNAGLPPAIDADPGRVRYEPFFTRMYGDCRKGETAKTLEDVVWLPRKWGRSVRVTRVNGVAARLTEISAALDQLASRFDPFLFPPAGTLNCRAIAGTNRLSAHGTASAIDIATAHAHYWFWGKPDAAGHYIWRNEIPMDIVEVFEHHGFIWGGKWYHFDTMHFEYRPEILAVAGTRASG